MSYYEPLAVMFECKTRDTIFFKIFVTRQSFYAVHERQIHKTEKQLNTRLTTSELSSLRRYLRIYASQDFPSIPSR